MLGEFVSFAVLILLSLAVYGFVFSYIVHRNLTEVELEPGSRTEYPETLRPNCVHCPHCGAQNETGYTFCQNCVADMNSLNRS